MIEKAILITKIDNLKHVLPKYTRLYFGNEFCQNMLPTEKDIEKIIHHCSKNKLDFSLVTPYVTDEGLERIEQLLVILKNSRLKSEIIINDWGTLSLLNEKYSEFQPVLGRLLTKQSRDPRIARLLNYRSRPTRYIKKGNNYVVIFTKAPPATLVSYYKKPNVDSPIIQNFLREQKINRVELDNLFIGIDLNIPRADLSASLYVPYGYITTTRFCFANLFQTRKKFYCRISNCEKQCQKYAFRLINPEIKKVIYQKGNTMFFNNKKIPVQKELIEKGINRIVFQPEIPV